MGLVIPAFIAGIFTFLAPCTLPLVPGYLAFISGASVKDLQDPEKAKTVRWKIFLNGVFFVVGFSAVFILLGTLVGIAGQALVPYRIWLTRIGGVFVIAFGLLMMNVIKIPFLSGEHRFTGPKSLQRGSPVTSLILGGTFGLGWTPCVGPILGSVLLLASTTGSIGEGAWLLTAFSLGLAIPFLLLAAAYGTAAQKIKNITKYLNVISVIGGIFLIGLGILLVTNQISLLLSWGFRLLEIFNYEEFIYKFL